MPSCYDTKSVRVGEFLKISKSCNENVDEDEGTYSSCNALYKGDIAHDGIIYQLTDGITIGTGSYNSQCKYGFGDGTKLSMIYA